MPRWWAAGYAAFLHLPALGYFRAPARYTLLTSLGLALLAGQGLDRATSPRRFRAAIVLRSCSPWRGRSDSGLPWHGAATSTRPPVSSGFRSVLPRPCSPGQLPSRSCRSGVPERSEPGRSRSSPRPSSEPSTFSARQPGGKPSRFPRPADPLHARSRSASRQGRRRDR